MFVTETISPSRSSGASPGAAPRPCSAPSYARFVQADPFGYDDGMNIYAYAKGDPVNLVDPTGTAIVCRYETWAQPVLVDGKRTGKWVNHRTEVSGCRDTSLTSARDALAAGGRKAPKPKPKPREKKLPKCMQNFLKGRIASNPSRITLHQSSPFNVTGNSVTFGNDIYLAGNAFGRTDKTITIHKFHEIHHTSQYAQGYSALNQAFAYIAFGGHNASPFEQAADTFARTTYEDYKAAGLDKTCPF